MDVEAVRCLATGVLNATTQITAGQAARAATRSAYLLNTPRAAQHPAEADGEGGANACSTFAARRAPAGDGSTSECRRGAHAEHRATGSGHIRDQRERAALGNHRAGSGIRTTPPSGLKRAASSSGWRQRSCRVSGCILTTRFPSCGERSTLSTRRTPTSVG